MRLLHPKCGLCLGGVRAAAPRIAQLVPEFSVSIPSRITCALRAASTNATNTMSANQLQTPVGASEIAISETLKQVKAKALELLLRRRQLNRRISRLNKTMKGLRDFATVETFMGCDSARPAQACAKEPARPQNYTRSRGDAGGRMGSSPSGRSRHLQVTLTRACRIALLEAGGAASTDDIHRLIVRRGSFSFSLAAYGSADAAIIRTLKAMTRSGEVRRIETLSQLLWQQTAQDRESWTSLLKVPFATDAERNA